MLKPLIYAGAFAAGVCAPDTVLEDSPTAWTGYAPSDYDRQFRGSMTAAEALAESRNIPAMLVLSKVGVEPAIGLMESAGLRTLARSRRSYGLSLAIGGAEATPMELAQAYAMLGRGGMGMDVTFVTDDGNHVGSAPRIVSTDAQSRVLGGNSTSLAKTAGRVRGADPTGSFEFARRLRRFSCLL